MTCLPHEHPEHLSGRAKSVTQAPNERQVNPQPPTSVPGPAIRRPTPYPGGNCHQSLSCLLFVIIRQAPSPWCRAYICSSTRIKTKEHLIQTGYIRLRRPRDCKNSIQCRKPAIWYQTLPGLANLSREATCSRDSSNNCCRTCRFKMS